MDKHSALQFMGQLAKIIDWLERHSGALKQPKSVSSIATAKTVPNLAKSQDASALCDHFMKEQRRVPRNICNDPAVEAKKALTGTFKCGLTALRKSILDCLNEADEIYIHEFCSALKETAKLYFPFELNCTFSMSDQTRKISVVVSRIDSDDLFEIHALQIGNNRAEADIWKGSADDYALAPATEHDFDLLISTNGAIERC